MNICCLLLVVLLLVVNYVGQVLYANNVGRLLYVVFAPPAVSAPRTDCTAPADSFAVGENSKHRNGISLMRLLILIFIVICYFWRFICFVAVFCSLVDTFTT